MPDVVIENPVINSPFEEPRRHFVFGREGITGEIAEGRRPSSFFIPIAAPKKRSAQQQSFETQWTQDRVEENHFINRVREQVVRWRAGGYQGVTPTTRMLLEHWASSERMRPFFFCQREAAETALFIAEVASRYGQTWVEKELEERNRQNSETLVRQALKIATGGGKTVVMAMLIAWHTLNKLANPQARAFGDAFLLVTPGITIRDRLRVLLPNDPDSYYRTMEIVPPDRLSDMQQAQVVITNYHAFLRHDRSEASKLTKSILAGDRGGNPFVETPDEMVERVCRGLNRKRRIVVINDEAHHCYHRAVAADAEKLVGEERREAEENSRAAEVWVSGIEAVRAKRGVRVVYDLSATPFYLRGSGHGEGTLFPWVVSDFSLIDAIESGIVKVPRVPVADDRVAGVLPTYRDIWPHIRTELAPALRDRETLGAEPRLPAVLEGALRSLYGHYEQCFRVWEAADTGRPPVFIVVCSNTRVSKLVFDWVAGWDRTLPDGTTRVIPGHLSLFSNEHDGAWRHRPNTILVDSRELESGEGMSADFKRVAAREIEEFKREYETRFQRSADEITDEELLREVMNTVGKPGRLGEPVRCVVSVSMLTEGWDANTVTHVLGVRAFGTQLLCEQVVGRALRRMSYAVDEDGRFPVEYAEVYGVPFSFIPSPGAGAEPKPPKPTTRVRAREDRANLEISFPHVVGYRFEVPGERLSARFDRDSAMVLTNREVPTQVELDPIVGKASIHTLDDLRDSYRPQEVAFHIAREILHRSFTDDSGTPRVWLFPQLVDITRRWMAECVTTTPETFVQLLILAELRATAARKIHRAIVSDSKEAPVLRALLRAHDPMGFSRVIDFDTVRPVLPVRKSHVDHLVLDSDWEAKMGQVLERMPEVVAWVKNDHLGFAIPYESRGRSANYLPDFVAVIERAGGERVNLIVEVSGRKNQTDRQAKAETAATMWVPAVNNLGEYGRWDYVEITDPWVAENTLRDHLGLGAGVAHASA